MRAAVTKKYNTRQATRKGTPPHPHVPQRVVIGVVSAVVDMAVPDFQAVDVRGQKRPVRGLSQQDVFKQVVRRVVHVEEPRAVFLHAGKRQAKRFKSSSTTVTRHRHRYTETETEIETETETETETEIETETETETETE